MIARLSRALAVFAALGLFASAAMNLSFWLGHPILLDHYSTIVTTGLVLALPTVMVAIPSGDAVPRDKRLTFLLRGAPSWLPAAFVSTFAYDAVQYTLGLLGIINTTGDYSFRLGAAHSICLYAITFSLTYAAACRGADA